MNATIQSSDVGLMLEPGFEVNSGNRNVKGSNGILNDVEENSSDKNEKPRSTNSKALRSLQTLNLGSNGSPTGNGGFTSSNTSKNLSHVPCKFFRQGICQAGNNCPFSHNLEGTSAASRLPCKYFQKGNCKFGAKCALAHLLPDGTKVKTKPSYPQMGTSNAQRNSTSSILSAGTKQSDHLKRLDAIDINEHSLLGSSESSFFTPSHHNSFTNLSSKNISGSRPFSNGSDNFRSQHFGMHGSSQLSTPMSYSFQSALSQRSLLGSLSSNGAISYSATSTPTGVGSITFHNSLSNYSPTSDAPSSVLPSLSNDVLTHKISLSQQKLQMSDYISTANDSAVIDEYEEDPFDESTGLFEDYVPGSLSEIILTPQESERRGSRSQSGTLLVRPSLSSILQEKDDKRSTEADVAIVNQIELGLDKDLVHDDVFLME